MADVFKTPGVYLKEIPLFPPSIAEVETAIPAFIGYTETASFNGIDLSMRPTRISSLLEYESMFGTAQKENAISVTIADVLDGSTLISRTITADSAATRRSRFKMYYSLQMFFANGGGPCYIVSTGTYKDVATTATYADTDIDKNKLSQGLTEIAKFDEPTLLVFPDSTALNNSNYNALMGEALSQCADLKDRFTVMDVKPVTTGTNVIEDSMNDFRNSQLMESTIDKLKYGAAYFPFIETALNYRYDSADVSIVYKRTSGGVTSTLTDPNVAAKNIKLSSILNPPTTLDAGIRDGLNLKKKAVLSSPPAPPEVAGNTELFNLIKAELGKIAVVLPPSSAVVGVYASIDSNRGVWKAPANVSLSYVNAAAVKISHNDQMNLNVDATSGKSINAIRFFTGKGVLIWGARTLAGNDNEWRYIPVRRFFNFAEESIKKGTEFVVFEPNDANTWIRVKAMIENFLTKQWRAGALAGSKPEQAFFVNIGLGVTMTALDILEGRLNVEIGMAVVRPAEFIILKFSHKLQEA
jgi:phage tail sheath protein FI